MKFSHVTFIVGFTNDKKEIYALGGNQSSKVKIERYDRKKVMEYRFPISGGYSQLKQVETSPNPTPLPEIQTR